LKDISVFVGLILEERSDGVAEIANETIRNRHLERQKKRMRQMKRRRCITISVLISIVLLIIIFFTPIFKIRKIEIEGNNKVATAEIEGKLGKCMNNNIFRYRTSNPIKDIKSIPYIDNVVIKKSPFSSKITVTITECKPAAYVEVGEKEVVLDKKLKVLEVVDNIEYDIPEITNMSVVQVNPGETVGLENEGLVNMVSTCIEVLYNEGILKGVEYISFEDSNNIKFNYEERLDVVCGGKENFEKKIKLFNQAINTEDISDKARGTIDLSVSSRAVYTP